MTSKNQTRIGNWGERAGFALAVFVCVLGASPTNAEDNNALRAINAGLLTQSATTSGNKLKPSAFDIQSTLQSKIQEESGGQIRLISFKEAGAPWVRERDGEKIYGVSYDAEIEFAQPGMWTGSLGGKALSFKSVKLEEAITPPVVRSNSFVVVSGKGERFAFAGYMLYAPKENGWVPTGFGIAAPEKVSEILNRQCVNNLKAIGLSFRQWSLDNNDRFPFNTSTNSGGTMEYCAPGNDGFDANLAIHLRVMTNELNTTKVLICPADSSKRPAASFGELRAGNVSYQIRSGANVDESHPEEILAICPIHGHVCYCDGNVKEGIKK